MLRKCPHSLLRRVVFLCVFGMKAKNVLTSMLCFCLDNGVGRQQQVLWMWPLWALDQELSRCQRFTCARRQGSGTRQGYNILFRPHPALNNYYNKMGCILSLHINLSVSLQSCSVIGVETKDTWPGTVIKLRMVCIAVLFLLFQF